jgi:dynein light intermediate chain 2
VLGERKAGKSSLLQTFLSNAKEETPKATVALEYSYARAPAGLQAGRDICHIYELGGGRLLHSLVPIVVTPEVLSSLVVVIVLDLSSPHKVYESYLFWLQVLKARIDECLAELRARSPKLAQKLEARLEKQWGNHEDRATVSPFLVPVVAVASKFDVLANEESEKRKWMARCLRYFSHRQGVDLIYSSQRDARLQGAVCPM